MSLQTISPFKNCEKKITRVGLGGEGALRTSGMGSIAVPVIGRAMALGIGYYDSARVYQDSELYYGQFWKAHAREREAIFHTSKSADRSREGALAELAQTLDRLNTSYLDLWQIHDVRTQADLDAISAPGGALEAFVQARDQGLTRFIGVTGHHDPEILARAVEAWPVDAVLMPVNPVEKILGGFLTRTLDAARKKGLAVIGMKVLGGKHYLGQGVEPEQLIRFALSQDVDLIIVGCKTLEEVETLVRAGENPRDLSGEECQAILAPFASRAREFAFYRGSVFKAPWG